MNTEEVGGPINAIGCGDGASHTSTIDGEKVAAQTDESATPDLNTEEVGGLINAIGCGDMRRIPVRSMEKKVAALTDESATPD